MSDSVCTSCGCTGAHYEYCRHVNPPLQLTAYDRLQLEQTSRLDGALRRIEQLELEVARLKAWSRPPAEMCLVCGAGFTTPEHRQKHSCGSGEIR